MARLRMSLFVSLKMTDYESIPANQHGGGGRGGGGGDPPGDLPFSHGGPPPPPPGPPPPPFPPNPQAGLDGDNTDRGPRLPRGPIGGDRRLPNGHIGGGRRVRQDISLPNGDLGGMRPKRRKLQEDSEKTESQDFGGQGIAVVQPAESENERAYKKENPEKVLHMCINTVQMCMKSITHLTELLGDLKADTGKGSDKKKDMKTSPDEKSPQMCNMTLKNPEMAPQVSEEEFIPSIEGEAMAEENDEEFIPRMPEQDCL